jgi:hypothetical protein
MKLINKIISYVCVGLISTMPMLSLAATPIGASPEVKDGYVVGFFNAAGNTDIQAQLSLALQYTSIMCCVLKLLQFTDMGYGFV